MRCSEIVMFSIRSIHTYIAYIAYITYVASVSPTVIVVMGLMGMNDDIIRGYQAQEGRPRLSASFRIINFCTDTTEGGHQVKRVLLLDESTRSVILHVQSLFSRKHSGLD